MTARPPVKGHAPSPLVTGLAAFVLASCVRLLFLQATPDRAWAHSALFQGDAHVWLAYASALRSGSPFELGIPLRPPATAHLLAAFGAGTDSLFTLRLLWSVFGALTAGCLAYVAARAWGAVAGLATGFFAATSTSLLLLSSSLDAEAPYLALVAASMLLVERRPRLGRLAVWTALQALACLFRVEHVLFLVLAAPLWFFRGADVRPRGRALLAATAVVFAVFAAVLAPWHLAAWGAIARFNTEEPARSPGEERALRQIEASVRGMDWDPAAAEARTALPAFTRRTTADFVAATVAWRGGRRVTGPDFAILQEAFATTPRPLAAHPFIALYGPLNFALANHDRASGGFSRVPLEDLPPLHPSAEAYPPELVSFLPPPDLTLAYPPHLALVNDGYRVGGAWMAAHPSAFARLAGGKLGRFLSGATLGVTGYGWPLGTAGVRRLVDLTVPPAGLAAWGWRGLLVGFAFIALRAAPRPLPCGALLWGVFALGKVAVTLAFFGYARQGALLAAPLALAVGMAVSAGLRSVAPRKQLLAMASAALLVLGAEVFRAWSAPVLVVDGAVVGATEPAGEDVHREAVVEVR